MELPSPERSKTDYKRLGCSVVIRQEITREEETIKTNLIINFVQNTLVLKRSLGRVVGGMVIN